MVDRNESVNNICLSNNIINVKVYPRPMTIFNYKTSLFDHVPTFLPKNTLRLLQSNEN